MRLVVAGCVFALGCSSSDPPAESCRGQAIELALQACAPGSRCALSTPTGDVVVDDARSGCIIARGDGALFAKNGRGVAPSDAMVAFRIRGPGLLPTIPLDYQMPRGEERPPLFFGLPALTEGWRSALPPLTASTSPILVIVYVEDAELARCGEPAGLELQVPDHPTAVVRYLSATAPFVPVASAIATTSSGLATVEGVPPGATTRFVVQRDRCRGWASVAAYAGAVVQADVSMRFN